MTTLLAKLLNPALDPKIGAFSDNGTSVIQTFLSNGMTFAFGLAVVILMIMLIIGSYEYITAGGDKEGLQKATKRMTQAIIGLLILFSIYLIANVVGTLFGINVLQLNIPKLV